MTFPVDENCARFLSFYKLLQLIDSGEYYKEVHNVTCDLYNMITCME